MRNTMLRILCTFFLLGNITSSVAQKAKSPTKTNIWQTLANVTFKKKYDEMLGYKVDVPIFGKTVKALAGKEVTVKGYIIPVEGYGRHDYFVFSAYPYNMCYFCGGAGPETVMEVFTKKDNNIKYTAQMITIKGKLVLNSKDVNKLMYLLEDAILTK